MKCKKNFKLGSKVALKGKSINFSGRIVGTHKNKYDVLLDYYNELKTDVPKSKLCGVK